MARRLQMVAAVLMMGATSCTDPASSEDLWPATGGAGGSSDCAGSGKCSTAVPAGGSSLGASVGGSTGASGGPVAASKDAAPAMTSSEKNDLVDDLEDGDDAVNATNGRRGHWYSFNDGAGTQTPTAGAPLTPEAGGARGSKRAVHTRGSGFSIWGAGIGVDFANDGVLPTSGQRQPYDASQNQGIAFWVKGTGSLRLKVRTVDTEPAGEGGKCATTQEGCSDSFGAPIPVTDTWQEVKIPFGSLVQEGWGVAAPTPTIDAKKLLGVSFQHTDTKSGFDFWIDDLAFYASSTTAGDAGSGTACASPPKQYANGSVTWYALFQGSNGQVNCHYPVLSQAIDLNALRSGSGHDVIESVATGNGRFFGAMNTADYASAAACGACAEVKRENGKSVVVTIVDQCPTGSNPVCKAGHIDLSYEAFLQIGTEVEGYLGTTNGGGGGKISWKYVACPTAGNVTYKDSDGKILVENHRFPIARVEGARRLDYNVWEGIGVPGSISVTDVNGATITTTRSGSAQFPACAW